MLATDQNGNEKEIKICLLSGGKQVEICPENADTLAQMGAKNTPEHVEAMRAAFHQHCNKQHWKNGFEVVVPKKKDAEAAPAPAKADGKVSRAELEALGGSYWEKGAMQRVYFNNIAELYGLETSRYNTGNVSSATLDGQDISNSKAKKVLSRLGNAKLWYDMGDGKFHGKGFSDEYDDMDVVVAALRQHMAEGRNPAASSVVPTPPAVPTKDGPSNDALAEKDFTDAELAHLNDESYKWFRYGQISKREAAGKSGKYIEEYPRFRQRVEGERRAALMSMVDGSEFGFSHKTKEITEPQYASLLNPDNVLDDAIIPMGGGDVRCTLARTDDRELPYIIKFERTSNGSAKYLAVPQDEVVSLGPRNRMKVMHESGGRTLVRDGTPVGVVPKSASLIPTAPPEARATAPSAISVGDRIYLKDGSFETVKAIEPDGMLLTGHERMMGSIGDVVNGGHTLKRVRAPSDVQKVEKPGEMTDFGVSPGMRVVNTNGSEYEVREVRPDGSVLAKAILEDGRLVGDDPRFQNYRLFPTRFVKIGDRVTSADGYAAAMVSREKAVREAAWTRHNRGAKEDVVLPMLKRGDDVHISNASNQEYDVRILDTAPIVTDDGYRIIKCIYRGEESREGVRYISAINGKSLRDNPEYVAAHKRRTEERMQPDIDALVPKPGTASPAPKAAPAYDGLLKGTKFNYTHKSGHTLQYEVESMEIGNAKNDADAKWGVRSFIYKLRGTQTDAEGNTKPLLTTINYEIGGTRKYEPEDIQEIIQQKLNYVVEKKGYVPDGGDA